MKQFITRIIFLFLCLLTISFILSEIEFSDEFIISKTKNTNFEKVAWSLNLIKNNPEQIKGAVVFLGPSLFLTGINDSLLNLKGIKTVNLAINHVGNETMLFIVSRIKDLAPQEIVLYKSSNPILHSHKLSPLLFKPSELYHSGQGLNFYLVQHLFKRLKLVGEYFSFSYFKTNEVIYQSKSNYGVRINKKLCNDYEKIKENSHQKDETMNLYQNKFKYSYEKESTSFITKINSIKRRILDCLWFETNLYNAKSQTMFVSKIKEYCLRLNIECRMLYVPSIKDVESNYAYKRNYFRNTSYDLEIFKFSTYKSFDKATLWSDFQHMSKYGASVFTNKLIDNNFFKKEKYHTTIKHQ